jgi:hypothetical protein
MVIFNTFCILVHLNTIDPILKSLLQALEVQGKALGPRHFRAYDEVVAKHGWVHILATWVALFWGISQTHGDVLIVKHEANVMMNLNKQRSQSHKKSKGSYTYSLIMGGILCLIIGVRSLPPIPKEEV